MDLTQQLVFSQEELVPDQVGGLWIQGLMYPVKTGPNKIGRDPDTCDIVIKSDTISRQHALINVLKDNQCLIMDMGSSNRTKLNTKTLQPYMPVPISDCDTVYFGETVFGVYRSCNTHANDLPMTQAELPMTQIEVPETPIAPKKGLHKTILPESPNASNRSDGSFLVPSQPIERSKPTFKQKTSLNDSRDSSTESSIAFHIEDSDGSINDSTESAGLNCYKKDEPRNIHEMETQMYIENRQSDNIHILETQLLSQESPSIYSMQTQVPSAIQGSDTQMPIGTQSIHNMEKQDEDNLPQVKKLSQVEAMEIEISTSKNKFQKTNKILSKESQEKKEISESDEEILFNEFESEDNVDIGSQFILGPTDKDIQDLSKDIKVNPSPIKPEQNKSQESTNSKGSKTVENSDSDTDCEDFDLLPTQNISKVPQDDDLTDCEDSMEIIPRRKKRGKLNDSKNKLDISIHEQSTQIINASYLGDDLSDMPTQILDENKYDKKELTNNNNKVEVDDINFAPIQVSVQNENLSPFKMPIALKAKKLVASPAKRKLFPAGASNDSVTGGKTAVNNKENVADINHYENTQDIICDLMTQKIGDEDFSDIVASSQENYKVGPRFPGLGDQTEMKSDGVVVLSRGSSASSDDGNKVVSVPTKGYRNELDSTMSSQNSEMSDFEETPVKKQRTLKFLQTELPSSQDISKEVAKSKVLLLNSDSSSDTETEESGKQNTPIVFKKKSKKKNSVKKDLSKKFEEDALPKRIMTRRVKPTAKMEEIENASDISKHCLRTNNPELRHMDKNVSAENLKSDTSKEEHKHKNLKIQKVESKPNKSNLKTLNKEKANQSKEEIKKATSTKSIKEKLKETWSNSRKDVITSIDATKDKSEKRERGRPKKGTSKTCENLIESHKELHEPKRKVKKETKNSVKEDKRAITKKNQKELETQDSQTRYPKREKKSETLPKDTNFIEKEDTIRRSDRQKPSNSKYIETKPPIKRVAKKTKHKSDSEDDVPVKRTRRNATKSNLDSEIENNQSDQKGTTNKPKTNLKSRSSLFSSDDDKPLDNIKCILKNKFSKENTSKVYNLVDTDSDMMSPDSSKRKPNSYSTPLVSLLTDTSVSSLSSTTSSGRRTPSVRSISGRNVLFTAFTQDKMIPLLKKLRANLVEEPLKCSVLVTQQIKRTFKLMCAVGLGKPIVGASWLQACKNTNTYVDPWLYLLKDEDAEKRFSFNLQRTLKGPRDFLNGYNLSATPKVLPSPQEMKLIVECSGGTWREGCAGVGTACWLCVSCAADRVLWPMLRARGATIVSAELVLTGVFRQELNIKKNLL